MSGVARIPEVGGVMSNNRLLVIAGLVCLLLALIAPAQDFRATITGVVTDQSGAAVPGATVKVTRINTNETEETKTNAGGRYTVPYLNPAEYNVEITASGFKTLK